MRQVRFVAGFAAGCATVLLAAAAYNSAQDPPQPGGGGAPPTEEELAQMQMWQEWMDKYGNPSTEHDQLARLAGEWTYTSEWFDAPGAEGHASNGTANFQMLMGNRYLLGEYSGDMMGTPFEGTGCTAYDRFQKKYVNIWIDNMSTGFMISEGRAKDSSGSVIEFVGQMPDPKTEQMCTVRTVEKFLDEDNYVMEMYAPVPGQPGKEFLMGRMVHKRSE